MPAAIKSFHKIVFPDINISELQNNGLIAFRLKFLARFLNEEYHVLWKDIFRYFIHNILNMKLYHNLDINNDEMTFTLPCIVNFLCSHILSKALILFIFPLQFNNNGAHLVKYNTIICEKSKGGLQLPDIKSKLIAFRLKFLARFLNVCLLTELCQLL
jgi:hypothetical protein